MSSAMLAAITSQQIQPALFVQIIFADDTIYLWSGYGSISWNSQTWTGVGMLGQISTIEEATTVEAKGVVLTLSGIDPTMLAEALQEVQLGASVTVWLGFFSGTSLIFSPIIAWAGRVDQPTFLIGGETASLSINCESRLLDMNVAVDRRYTLEDSQMDDPGDLYCMFVNSIQEITLSWGASNLTNANV